MGTRVTTPSDVLAYADSVRGKVGRDYYDPTYSAHTWVQDQEPYNDGRFAGQSVQMCGIAVAHYLAHCGLRLGVDFPSEIQYAPGILRQINYDGWGVDTPAPGDIGVVNWNPGDGEADHVVLVVGTDNWPNSVSTLEANTSPEGTGEYYERPAYLLAGFARPHYTDQAAAPAATPAPPVYLPKFGDDEMVIIRVPGRLPLGVLGGVMFPLNDASVGGTAVTELAMSEGEFAVFYADYCKVHRLNAKTGQPL